MPGEEQAQRRFRMARRYRVNKELTLAEVCEATQIGYTDLVHFERGTKMIGSYRLLRLAEFYGVDVRELCADDPDGERLAAATEKH